MVKIYLMTFRQVAIFMVVLLKFPNTMQNIKIGRNWNKIKIR
jgi:hypothetical protein